MGNYRIEVTEVFPGYARSKQVDSRTVEASGLSDLAAKYDRLMNGTKAVSLPEDMKKRTIAAMAVGDSGFTVSWAMFMGGDGRLYLRPDYTLESRVMGTFQMPVRREADGYHVTPVKDVKYDPSATSEPSSAPVVRLARR